MKTQLISSRFLDEATNHRWSRFLREATGDFCYLESQPKKDPKTRRQGLLNISGLLQRTPRHFIVEQYLQTQRWS